MLKKIKLQCEIELKAANNVHSIESLAAYMTIFLYISRVYYA